MESVPVVHHDVEPLLTPSAIVDASVEWKPSGDIGLLVGGRWVDEAQLDNTGNEAFRTPSFLSLDAQAGLSLARWVRRGAPRIRVQATNLLDDDRLWPSGYSYLYFTRDAAGGDTLEGTRYYYPLATRTVLSIVGAVLLSRLMDNPVHVTPLKVSKVNTAAQLAFLVSVLGLMAAGEGLGPLVNYGSIPVALLTVLSGAAYLNAWLRHMAETPHEDNKR